MISELRDFNFV